MKFLLEKSLERLEAASRMRRARNYEGARREYLKSAEYLLQAADQTEGRLREARMRDGTRPLDSYHPVQDGFRDAADIGEEGLGLLECGAFGGKGGEVRGGGRS